MPRRQPHKYHQCKGTRRHDWFLTDVQRASSFGTPTWHMCALCSTVRITIIDRLGQIASRYYKHPRDYKEIQITSAEYRLQEISQYRAQQRQNKKEGINT
jgi:hypothetical protein